VIVDRDLADFYGIATKRLNEQVKRNADRFPRDFVFQLTEAEKAEVVAECDHLKKLKFSKVMPFVFTEHGALMAASVLNTPTAVEMSVFIVRAFVNLRRNIANHKELAARLNQLERRLTDHDGQIVALVRAIRELASPEALAKKRRIGFAIKEP
jgi:hypothetical protein